VDGMRRGRDLDGGLIIHRVDYPGIIVALPGARHSSSAVEPFRTGPMSYVGSIFPAAHLPREERPNRHPHLSAQSSQRRHLFQRAFSFPGLISFAVLPDQAWSGRAGGESQLS